MRIWGFWVSKWREGWQTGKRKTHRGNKSLEQPAAAGIHLCIIQTIRFVTTSAR